MMKMPKLWAILKDFKRVCKSHGWKASESEDWIEVNEQYHTFLWSRDVHPSSFKKIVSNRKCVVREGLSYRVVNASFTAWLFSETPAEALMKTVFENPNISSKIAIYDLSPLFEGKSVCKKLNCTNSLVFREFESFLKDEMKAKFKSFPPISNLEASSENFHVAELA